MEILADSIVDKTFLGGNKILKQGTEVDPCLYLVREGAVTLSTSDGKFSQKVLPGGYFGVEQLLIPKNCSKEKRDNVRLPAQWTVTVSGSKPCVCGVLRLADIQAVLDNDGKPTVKPEEVVVDTESPILQKRTEVKTSVQATIALDNLEMISVLGEGEFGEVWLVAADVDKEKKKFALKVLSKKGGDAVKAIEREIAVTQTFHHPFIVGLVNTYDTEDSIYMLMGLVTGGELWDVVHKEDDDGNWTSGIPELQAKFYALLVADTMAYMHGLSYLYRDLKPENVMIDSEGYPVLVDFGFAKCTTEKTYTFCGTPNYVAPEIVTNSGHHAGVDHWALGVLIYEMITGDHPFFSDEMDQMAVYESITSSKHYPFPSDVSTAVVNLVDGLLEKDASQRLGMLAGGEKDITTHKWFAGMDLSKLRSKKIKAPWIPPRD
jgi:hypothetical protein